MEDLKYNYVIFGSTGYYLAGYHDIIGYHNVYYIQDFYQGFQGFVKKLAARMFFSEKVNKVVKTPFTFYVYPRLVPDVFKDNKPLCFVFFEHWYRLMNSTYISYVKEQYPNSKCVLYMQDLVDKSVGIDIDSLRKKMDLIISYDKYESQKYIIDYYPTPMSCVKIQDNDHISRSDFYFCGKPKERYFFIRDLYVSLKDKGYSCDFIIIGDVKEEDKVEGITYQTTPFDYFDNLAHVSKTKCVVEIMQQGAKGYTPRLWEAIVNDKHLLTNNDEVSQYKYYDGEKIHIIENSPSDDFAWVNTSVTYDIKVKESLSPLNFLKYVDNKLQEK